MDSAEYLSQLVPKSSFTPTFRIATILKRVLPACEHTLAVGANTEGEVRELKLQIASRSQALHAESSCSLV